MSALELTDAVKRYGNRTALDRVSLSLAAGECLGLLGPNGAGKTTALRLLLGFSRATSGGVVVRGLEPGDPASRRSLGYLPERLVFPGRASPERLLRFHAALCQIETSRVGLVVEAALEQVGLTGRGRDRVEELSKGLRQRLGFALALLGQPELLLLDEPTSGLDPIGIRDARGWIEAARERGCAVLISSHGLSEVERVCDRVAILHEGRMRAEGALEDVTRPGESLEDAFVRAVRG